jgi:hypothetical protein
MIYARPGSRIDRVGHFSLRTPLNGALSAFTLVNCPVEVLRSAQCPDDVLVCERPRTAPIRDPLPVFFAMLATVGRSVNTEAGRQCR